MNPKPVARLAAVGVVGTFGAALCLVSVAPVALTGAALVFIGLPGWAVACALAAGDSDADRADLLAGSFGGLAVSSAALWIAGATVGLSRSTILAAPLMAALVLSAATPAEPRHRRSFPQGFGALVLLSALFALLVAIPFYPYGLERSDGVHRMGLGDWYLHLMMTSTLDSASSLPPTNPYLLAHQHAHYHYAFHLLAAAIHRAAGRPVDVFPILLGLTMLTAAAFPLVLFVIARRRLDGDAKKALIVAAAGSLLAGLDLVVWATYVVQTLFEKWPLPPGLAGLRLLIPSAHLHSWIPIYERQFNAPYVALLWAPHYVAAVLVSLLCLHALRRDVDRPPLFAVAFLLAALPGLSAYVMLPTVLAVVALIAADQWRSDWSLWRSPTTRRWLLAGAGAMVLALPILMTLKSSVGQHVAPLVLHVSWAGTLRNGAVFTFLFGDRQWTRLLDTPALAFFQFGMIGLLGFVGLFHRLRERQWSEPAGEHALVIGVVFAFLVLFRPPIGMDNNLACRPMLLVWSLLVPFAVEAWFMPPRFAVLRWIGVGLCAAAIPYAALGATLEGYLFWPDSPAMVATARWINRNTPIDAAVALDPEDHPRAFDYWLRRPLVEAEHRRNAFMLGAPPAEFETIRETLHEAYTSAETGEAAKRFIALGARVVVVHAGTQGALPWRDLPCFPLEHSDAGWLVLFRTDESCPLS